MFSHRDGLHISPSLVLLDDPVPHRAEPLRNFGRKPARLMRDAIRDVLMVNARGDHGRSDIHAVV